MFKVSEVYKTRIFAPSESPYGKLRTILLISLFLLLFSGCEHPQTPSGQTAASGSEQEKYISVYSQYSPVKTDILPLTEFVIGKETQQNEINLFVSLLDAFGSQIKSPCIFRFELYARVQHSSDPKGDRVMIWPDMDLNDPVINNEYWRNFLRAYEFNLPFEPQSNQPYILEVTCICPNNKRIASEFILKVQKESM
ncbi:MAG: hypothetical protein JW787_03145 [Sedimentisphaerales bacterium]|nr:hypothetical protein [Sedimentisphaerales bacterium]